MTLVINIVLERPDPPPACLPGKAEHKLTGKKEMRWLSYKVLEIKWNNLLPAIGNNGLYCRQSALPNKSLCPFPLTLNNVDTF